MITQQPGTADPGLLSEQKHTMLADVRPIIPTQPLDDPEWLFAAA